MNNRLKDVASASVNTYPPGKKFKHTFCETDEHGFNECEAKELCAYFGLDNHCSQKCFWFLDGKYMLLLQSSRSPKQVAPGYGSKYSDSQS